MDERDLIQRAQHGDRVALGDICSREWQAVYDLLYRTVQNRAEAQDLTQEVFLRALRSFDRYQMSDKPFHSFLVTVALNLLRDRWRGRRPFPTDLTLLPNLMSSDPGPEQQVLAGLDQAAIKTALATLPEDYQTVIRLRVLEGMTAKEVALVMNRKADAIRQLQHRALVALRVALREESLR